ncbi:MAG: Smr/MutS family protein [Acholeplasmataceae bacterium]|nr:Smr/MutS family protein [Acholeplasmataceae bacterium]
MKSYNIKSGMPDVRDAGKELARIIRASQGQKAIKIIHGYGSTGIGGAIKAAVRKSLRKRKRNNEIKAFIPGEAFSSLMGFDDDIRDYRDLLSSDSDFKSDNPGITYVIL